MKAWYREHVANIVHQKIEVGVPFLAREVRGICTQEFLMAPDASYYRVGKANFFASDIGTTRV